MKEYIEIGHTKKTRGIEGEMKIHIKDSFLEDFMQAEVIFLKLQGGPVPFFVERIREAGGLLVKLDEIDTPEDAVELTGKAVYLPKEELGGIEKKSLDLSMLEGFSIIDEAEGAIGVIEEVLELPQQMMAVVPYQGREVLIPLTDELITEVNAETRTLRMSLPAGLLNL